MAGGQGETVAYFGYGSLVNLSTLRTPYIAAFPATLRGWERVWLSRPSVPGSFAPVDGLAFLSARKNAGIEIDGVVIVDRTDSLEAVDQREALYRRHRIQLTDITIHRDEPFYMPLFMYVADTPPPAGHDSRILRSYLDAVFQGYLTHFGEGGLQRFMDTTANFDLSICEDRAEPVYPRPVKTSKTERALFETHRALEN